MRLKKKVGGKIVAIDLGGTNLRIGLVEGKRILKYHKEKTLKTGREIKKRIFELVEEFMSKEIRGIAVASAGPLKDGVIKNPPNLPFKNYNLKKDLEKKFGVSVAVKNDADCVAYAELELGYKRKNFVLLTLGTGIGGGVVIDGKVYRGEGYAGEVGHIILDSGRDFESLAASKRLNRITKKVFGEEKMFYDLMKMKDKKAKDILSEFVDYYGQGIASLIHCFDPEVVILAGGVSECGDKFLDLIRKSVVKYVKLPKRTPIYWTKLKHPGILGASLCFGVDYG